MSDRPKLPGTWISHPGFDPSKLRAVDEPPTGGTPVPPDPDRAPDLLKHVDVVYTPNKRHECVLPELGDHPVGTIVACRTCGKRYQLKWLPGRTWVRRYWPWPR